MKSLKKIISVSIIVPWLLGSGSLYAETCSQSDVTFEGSDSSGCFITPQKGNTTFEEGLAASKFGSEADNPWMYLVKDESSPTTVDFSGTAFDDTSDNEPAPIVEFTLDAPQATSGTWTLGWTYTNAAQITQPLTMDFVVLLKGSTSTAGYLFEDETLQLTSGSGEGWFEVVFTNGGGQVPALSHMTIVARQGDGTTPPPPVYDEVPEPSTILLLGLGIGSLVVIRRRRSV